MTSNHKADHTLGSIGTDIHGPAPLVCYDVHSCVIMQRHGNPAKAGSGTPVEEVESEAAEPAANQERVVKRSQSREWAPLLACERGAKGANQAQRAKRA